MTISAKVYESPQFGFPHVAIIVHNGEVVLSKAVRSVEEGERILEPMLLEFMERAAREGRRI